MDCQRQFILNSRVACIMFFAFLVHAPQGVKSEALQSNQVKQDSIVQHLVTGKIKDKKGIPLPGVTVRLDSTLAGHPPIIVDITGCISR